MEILLFSPIKTIQKEDTKMHTRAVIYARVSTSEQTKGYSLPSQIRGCKLYSKRYDLDVVATIKEDISGAKRLEEREGGAELMELVKNGKVNAVIVWRLDRLSRPPEGEYSRLLTTIEKLGRYDVAVHDCEMGEIKNSMESIMIAFFKGLAASKEREEIRERSMRGKLEKAKSGKWGWGGIAPFGYRQVGKGKDAILEIHPDEAKIVRRIFDMFLGRHGKPLALHAIAHILSKEGIPTPGYKRKDGQGLWQYNHIGRRILANRRYLGEFQYRGIILSYPHLAIVDEETWQLAQERLKRHKKRPRRKAKGMVYLLAGRMKCTCEGVFSAFHCKTKTKNGINIHSYYRCKRKTHYGLLACQESNMVVDEVDSLVWKWIVEIISNETRLEEIISEMVDKAANDLQPALEELDMVKGLLAKTERKVGRLMTAFGDEDTPTIADALRRELKQTASLKESLERQKLALQNKIANADITPEMRDEIKALAEKVKKRISDGGTKENKLELVEALNVQAELVSVSGGERRKIKLTCGLGNDVHTICIKNQSSA